MNFGLKRKPKKQSNKTAEKLKKQLQKDVAKNKHRRTHTRDECFVLAQLVILERGYTIDGAIMEASKRGMTFRPAVSFIEDRTGESIQIVLPRFSVSGEIRSSRPDGYGIFLFEAMSDEQMAQLQAANVEFAA